MVRWGMGSRAAFCSGPPPSSISRSQCGAWRARENSLLGEGLNLGVWKEKRGLVSDRPGSCEGSKAFF